MNDMANTGSNSGHYEEQRKQFFSDVRTFGKNAAEGKDALPMLAARVLKASVDGVITVPAKRPKDGRDDITLVYEEYANTETKKGVHERSDGGKKANISKLRKIAEFGASTVCDPISIFNTAVQERASMEAAGQNVKGAYPSYVDVARRQLNTDRPLEVDEIRAAIAKPEPKEKGVTDELTAIHKRLDQLVTGEKGLQCQEPQVLTAHQEIGSLLAMVERATKVEQLKAEAEELGVPLAAPETDSDTETEDTEGVGGVTEAA